ncbi:U1 small nuclear ribonucleoprotein A, putative [Plasmodium malariae]|uniref:U1 small nuclear ribonucleoprotein A, putative n=1 Tax=Plasmodium malariae TaxID=5858 RepID=A0A1D3TE02_PLAMA|nr:U1 small nuclear ribonucleoprotein A, putative [Plasmodium malariae]SCP03182.1 U1 small nuclear ribonucleoprotein A, putative [Plasmodium malariae]
MNSKTVNNANNNKGTIEPFTNSNIHPIPSDIHNSSQNQLINKTTNNRNNSTNNVQNENFILLNSNYCSVDMQNKGNNITNESYIKLEQNYNGDITNANNFTPNNDSTKRNSIPSNGTGNADNIETLNNSNNMNSSGNSSATVNLNTSANSNSCADPNANVNPDENANTNNIINNSHNNANYNMNPNCNPNMNYNMHGKAMGNAKTMYSQYPVNMNALMNMYPNNDNMPNPLRMPMYPTQQNIVYNNNMNFMNSKAYLKHLKYNKVITADPSIQPNETLYVKNLNDRIKSEEMKKSLKDLFKQYGVIEDLIVMKSFWRKGQAWIVYDNIESSTKALNALQGFVLFGKIMQINYSHNKSDIHSKRDGTFVERSKQPKKPKQILEREQRQKEIFERMHRSYLEMQMKNFNIMNNIEIEKKQKIDLSQMDKQALIAKAQAKAYEEKNKKKGEDLSKRNNINNNNNMYHPPFYPMNNFVPIQSNVVIACKILFVENVVENVNTQAFNDLFKNFAGFIEARIIPQRNVAFVDYSDEAAATYAMKALQNYELQGSKLKISYAKR